jgi:hypothetical protein
MKRWRQKANVRAECESVLEEVRILKICKANERVESVCVYVLNSACVTKFCHQGSLQVGKRKHFHKNADLSRLNKCEESPKNCRFLYSDIDGATF